MPIENNKNEFTEKAELVLTSSGMALSVAGLANPIAAVLAPIVSIAALPFAAYNSSLIRKQLNVIIDEFNRLETKLDNLDNLTEKQKDTFLLNEYKFLDYSLKEKTKEKITAYSKILSNSINKGYAFDESDIFDIQMDIINSLRLEDIVLLNFIFSYLENKKLPAYSSEFSKKDINSFIFDITKEKNALNEYALRHLVTLGMINERMNAKLPNTVGENIRFNDEIVFRYLLTQRCKMIRDVITTK